MPTTTGRLLPATQCKLFALTVITLTACCSYGQGGTDSLLARLNPDKFIAAVSEKAGKLEKKILDKSLKALSSLEKEERRLYTRMAKGRDSVYARSQLRELDQKYAQLKEKLKTPQPSGAVQYIPGLDSLNTALKFLDKGAAGGKLKEALAKTGSLQDKFNKTEQIKKFMRERKEMLKQKLENLGMLKQMKKLNKQVYYYAEQIRAYKEIFNDPKKMEKKALELLSRTKLFQDFFRKHSLFASLFRMPGDPNDAAYLASLSGLQTRAQVNNLVQQQIASGGPDARQQFQQSLQSAQSQLNELKNKVMRGGGGDNDFEVPDFKPNHQKTKSFFQRLEYGANIQTQKASSFFPVTTDIGLSLGYKLNDKSVIGIGTSYKLGWGRGWEHIRLTHQGIGLRSFIDVRIKGSFWLSGGYEQNFKTAFDDFDQLRDQSKWQKSGLVGLSKTVTVKSKFFKKTKIQMLWDFLSKEQAPRTQSLVFRIGYNLN